METSHTSPGEVSKDCDNKVSPPHYSNKDTLSSRAATLIVLIVFLISATGMILVFAQFPDLDEEDSLRLRLPRTIDDAKDLGRLLSKYKDSYYFTVLSSFLLTYILYPFWDL